MSEIFAPGSIAGPQGPTGPAGSQGNVTTLASSSLPAFVGRNLYDQTLAQATVLSTTDGSVTPGASNTITTGFIYCAGATSIVTNGRINPHWSGPCLYDANGGFLSAINPEGPIVMEGVAIALPGTQVYVRFGHVASWDNVPESAMMCFATITGTATLPSSYQAAGLATNALVDTKAALTQVSTEISQFAQNVTVGGPLSKRNAYNAQARMIGFGIDRDTGVVVARPGFSVSTVYCPASTSFITNLAAWTNTNPGTVAVWTYDAFGNSLAELSWNFTPDMLQNGQWKANLSLPLPGNQTYLKFVLNEGSWGDYGHATSAAAGVFYSGTVADPPPTTILGLPIIPFSGNTSTQVCTASSLGAVTGTGTDSTAVLNAFLATASATNPIKLILDGMFYTTGLVISPNGYTAIEGLGDGTGIVVAGPQDGIRIGAYTAATLNSEGNYGVAQPRNASHILLRDFMVNASGQVNALTDQPVAGMIAHPTYPIILANCSNIYIDNLYFPVAGACYCITLTNVDHARVSNCVFTTTGYIHDGVHVDGPSEDIGIENCDFNTGDDAIALNAPEGIGGDISRVTITNCRFHGSLGVLRIYHSYTSAGVNVSGPYKTRDVVVSNCTGVVRNICFVLGIEGGGLTPTVAPDQLQDLSISNCTFSAPINLLRVRDYVGTISLRGVKFIPTSANYVFDMANDTGELSLNDFSIVRNADGNTAPVVVGIWPTSTINRLSLLHCRVVDEVGTSYPPVATWVGNQGVISTLLLEAVDMTNVAALTWDGITTVLGSGVLGTGTQVPDASMGNNTLYLSSTAGGAPSIKVGGTAKRLTLT